MPDTKIERGFSVLLVIVFAHKDGKVLFFFKSLLYHSFSWIDQLYEVKNKLFQNPEHAGFPSAPGGPETEGEQTHTNEWKRG